MSTQTLKIKIIDEELEHLAEGGSELGPQLQTLIDQDINWYDEVVTKEVQGVMGGSIGRAEAATIRSYLYRKLVHDRKMREQMLLKTA